MKTIDLLDKQKIQDIEELITKFWDRKIDFVAIGTGVDSEPNNIVQWQTNWLISLLSEFLESNKEAVDKLKS